MFAECKMNDYTEYRTSILTVEFSTLVLADEMVIEVTFKASQCDSISTVLWLHFSRLTWETNHAI